MRKLSLDIMGIGFEVPHSPAVTLKGAKLDALAGWLTDPDSGFGLRPDQVRLKSTDGLFGYELFANFFGDNGVLVHTASTTKLEVKNLRTAGDWELTRQLIVRFYERLQFPVKSTTTFSAFVHSRVATAEDVDAYFAQFPQLPGATRPALFTYVKITDWESDIRLHVEKSRAFPEAGGIFVGWETHFTNTQDWGSFIGTLPTVMENSAHALEIGLVRT